MYVVCYVCCLCGMRCMLPMCYSMCVIDVSCYVCCLCGMPCMSSMCYSMYVIDVLFCMSMCYAMHVIYLRVFGYFKYILLRK